MNTEEPGMTTHDLFSAQGNHMQLYTSLPTRVFVTCAELGMAMALRLNGEVEIKPDSLVCGPKLHHNYITQHACCSTFKATPPHTLTRTHALTHARTFTHNCMSHAIQTRQCTYNVIFRRVCATIVSVEKQ